MAGLRPSGTGCLRHPAQRAGSHRVCGVNFGDTELKDYELTLPGKGKITPLLNSDWNCFGGRTARPKALRSKTTTGSVKLTLAPYSAQLYRFEPAVEKETK